MMHPRLRCDPHQRHDSARLEALEARTFLAGVTILTHGFQGNITGWVAKMSDDIAARAGGSSAATVYSMRVGLNGKQRLAVLSLARDRGSGGYRTTSAGEVIVKLDWSTVSGSRRYSTGSVADVVSGFLLAQKADDEAPRFMELPIHLIGHSRGASLMSALSQNLGRAGVWVDQQTNLDPHPVDGTSDLGADFGDAPMKTYGNVAFADTYWRSDGNEANFDPDGEEVAGTHNVSLNNSVQQSFIGSAHQSVPSYYDGTIDTKTSDGGDTPIMGSWYSGGNPRRTETGYAFSRVAAGARPGDGLWAAGGGSAARESAGQSGSQWANVTDVRVLGSRTVQPGQSIKVRFVRSDRDGNQNVSLFLDRDTNPYNDNFVRTLRRANVASAGNPTANRWTGSTGGASAGSTYWVCARITDSAGHARYWYSKSIQIIAPAMHAITRTARHSLPEQRIASADLDELV